ncbi:hypothetical protein HYC85_028133 [Camellia sinensis]|uniref:Retrotransposon gag domain-containing protein n=1 Tax=Camellia sinensis TaxID=4442 RepID=A0A7J7FUF6_CAMSI|nr:hypothetical protein HYC85_028133 [Camellia sinensis]
MLHIVLVRKSRSLGCEPCLRTFGLFHALPRFTNQALLSLFSLPKGRERSRRPSLSGRRLRFVFVGHFCPFGVRFSVFRNRWPCASVRDRLTTSVCPDFWHASYLLPFEGHCSPRDQLRDQTPLPVPNSQFSGPQAARFGPRTFILHQFCAPRTPCLPSAIPERFAGGLSCQGMTIRLTGCGLCQTMCIQLVDRVLLCPAGSSSTIASNPVDIPQALWTRGRRLNRSEHLIDGQPVFHSLPPVVKRRPRKRSVSEQRLPKQWVTPSEDNRTEVSIVAIEIDIPVSRMDQQNTSGMEALMRQMQESMRQMQEDAARQAEFSKQQAAIMAQQAELITRLQQQNAASASHHVPPPPGAPTYKRTRTFQRGQLCPRFRLNCPRHPDSPFEFEIDHTALKLSKLEKLFKKSQGVKAIPDIEDGYTDVAVTLPDSFKMPQIDRFDGSRDPMVHLRLFSDILWLMGLTQPQKLSLFGRTLSGVAAIWYAKLEDEVKRSWDEMAEAFVAQYSYNTQIEITTRDLETTRQEPKETFSDFVTRWRAKASMMTLRPTDKDQIRMIVRNLQPKLM